MLSLDQAPSLPSSVIFYEHQLGMLFPSEGSISDRFYDRKPAIGLLRELSILEANWDGYNASPIYAKVGANAQRFFGILEARNTALPTPEITPTPAGTIAMEWETAAGEAYIEIGITKFSSFIRLTSGQKQFYDGDAESMGPELLDVVQGSLFPAPSSGASTTSINLIAA